MDSMDAEGLIEQTLGYRNEFQTVGCATLIEPTDSLREIVWSAGLEHSDFGKAHPPESIILKEVKLDRFDKGQLLDYEDTPHTHRLRIELSAINEWIAQADLQFDMGQAKGLLVDTSDRHLRRIFTGGSLVFDRCGRLFGGFWQELTKEQRRAGLTINGSRVAVLDYGQMILRIAYGTAGVQPPSGDLYAIGNYAEHREGFKKLISAMLFTEKPLPKKPRGTGALLPKGINAGSLTGSVTRHHPGIAHLFNRGLGHMLMFKESEVLVAVLKELRDRSIVALPIHDALIVAEGNTLVTREVMSSVFHRMLGVEAIIKDE